MKNSYGQLFIDGASSGNPGPAGAGIVIKFQTKLKSEKFLKPKFKKIVKSKYLGKLTNNQAEYQALIFGLEISKQLGIQELECFSDSQLLIQQLNFKYKIKDPKLAKLRLKVWNLSQNFKKIKFKYLSREENKEADFLARKAIKER